MIGEFENRQSTVPITFSFRGLDIRYRLPDRKGVGIYQASEERLVLAGVSTPQDGAFRPTSIIGHTQCLWQFATGGVSSRAALATILRFPPKQPVPAATRP